MKEEKTEKTVGKNKDIHIRVTEFEKEMMKEKSKNYPSLSTLIIDAVSSFDTRKGRNRIDVMIEFSNCIRNSEVELARVGNNLNQVAHQLNAYKYGNTELPKIELVQKTLIENLEVNKKLLREIRKISNKNSHI